MPCYVCSNAKLGGGQEGARRRPGGSQEEARRRPGGGQEEARRRPGGSQQEARRRPGGYRMHGDTHANILPLLPLLLLPRRSSYISPSFDKTTHDPMIPWGFDL
jgi:hypothetical protein